MYFFADRGRHCQRRGQRWNLERHRHFSACHQSQDHASELEYCGVCVTLGKLTLNKPDF